MHLDNWLFVLFAAIALLFRWLAGQAAKANKNGNESERRSTSTPAPPLRPTRADSQEEQIRKFLEALGRPPTASPPPVVKLRSDVPPRPVAPITPPREMVATPASKRKAPPPPRVRLPDETPKQLESTLVSPPTPPIPPTVPANLPAPEIVRPQDKIDIVALLKSPNGLRDAIVLREIFGPPRGMKMSILSEPDWR